MQPYKNLKTLWKQAVNAHGHPESVENAQKSLKGHALAVDSSVKPPMPDTSITIHAAKSLMKFLLAQSLGIYKLYTVMRPNCLNLFFLCSSGFKCERCAFECHYGWESNLHLRKCTKTCVICRKEFRSRERTVRHEASAHTVKLPCP